ncbi:helix-turn-helix transcriptional regulator [Actinoplanes sp. NPDC051851]|uniref:helix-turn-helix domain-containing protein n=1 Tax=Actinoplanes sp. NPDC051851 TaxID=3154753 RepID=UPI00341CE0D1
MLSGSAPTQQDADRFPPRAAKPSRQASLTGQEREVVRLAAAGMTNREIGSVLFLSAHTVSSHLYNAFPKLGVATRAQLRDVIPLRQGMSTCLPRACPERLIARGSRQLSRG